MFRFQRWHIATVLFTASSLFLSCSVSKQIARSAKTEVLDNKALQAAHVGISIFDPAANQYLYNYQGDKYFVPASNTKIPTCYAAMKYLGDSLVGLKWATPTEKMYENKLLVFQANGDPTFLHKDYSKQPVFNFLQLAAKEAKTFAFMDTIWESKRWGSGWSWTDYDADYMAERSPFPAYGNVVTIRENEKVQEDGYHPRKFEYSYFKTNPVYFDTLVNKGWHGSPGDSNYSVSRKISENIFEFNSSKYIFKSATLPFVTHDYYTSFQILNRIFRQTKFYGIDVGPGGGIDKTEYGYSCPHCDVQVIHIKNWYKIHSQPTDSLLKPMMHRSDNFFAEQSLLMVSNEKLGLMNDEKIIDTLLKTDLKDLPQKPRWADGSGLSRYNLFTPQDLVSILNKMKNEFGMDRLKVIFPTGGEGTISSYYRNMSGSIFGKTGTLSGVVAFSGYLYTKKGRLLIFSTLVNNHQASATDVRRAVEQFLTGIRERY
ncbi:MAG: D-alanyl-D-alanine carboxypeptidase [Chitinophagaceae bacterium]|nr:D-alanyl-D-alanine carboxypeptidase [Chitinophagaceae bacterium]